LNRLLAFEHVQGIEENRIPMKVSYMNLETSILRETKKWMGRCSEGGWKREDGKGWKEREWKKFLRTARNHCILHMPME